MQGAMTALTLHYHPLSSYCQKVLIAIDLLGVEVDKRLLDLGNPAERDAYLALWPTGKMPLLVDQGRPVPESSIIIEHLQQRHAGGGRTLIPQDAAAALDVRLWDRLLDLYVMTPMQAFTADLLKPEGDRDPRSVARAREVLSMAYDLLDRRLEGRTWSRAMRSASPTAPPRRPCSMPPPTCRCRRSRCSCRPTSSACWRSRRWRP